MCCGYFLTPYMYKTVLPFSLGFLGAANEGFASCVLRSFPPEVLWSYCVILLSGAIFRKD